MAKWAALVFVFALLVPSSFTSSLSKCPMSCECDLDPSGRYFTECNEPKDMNEFEPREFDEKMEVIIVRNPEHTLTIGPLFSSFKKLETLRITGANVPAIGHRSFWGVSSLRTLDLSHNNITLVSDENFYGQQALVELNLSSNKIGRIPSGTFTYLTNLRILNLADNSLKKMLSSMFQNLRKLRYLDMSDNPLGELTPNVFMDLPDLRALKCRKCQLKSVDPHLYSLLRHLIELDLGENQLQYLDKDEFKDLKSLKRINLDGNQLSAIVNDLFQKQRSLEYLDLSRNRIRKISEKAFYNLSNLTELDISYNKLSSLELDYMCHLPKLEMLNISGNVQLNLWFLEPVFKCLNKLRFLSMADVSNIPMDFFMTLGNLQALNVSGTRLGNETSLLLEPLKKLKSLDLSRNGLNGFDEELTEKLLKIENVRFEKNQIICDVCNVGALLDRKHLMKWKYMPDCFFPEHLRGRPINRLVKENLIECYENYLEESRDAASIQGNLFLIPYSTIAFAGASTFVLMLLIIIISISICTRQRAHYYTRENGKGEQVSEKCLEGSLITGTEINFKFPLDEDRICTVDEICHPSYKLPPPPPPPNKLNTSMRSS